MGISAFNAEYRDDVLESNATRADCGFGHHVIPTLPGKGARLAASAPRNRQGVTLVTPKR